MAITTYLSEHEKTTFRTIADKDILELIEEVEQKTGVRYLIQEYSREKRQWFRKSQIKKVYTMYADMGHEAQVLNFAQDHDWSINTCVTKSYVITFLLGILNGLRMAK